MVQLEIDGGNSNAIIHTDNQHYKLISLTDCLKLSVVFLSHSLEYV